MQYFHEPALDREKSQMILLVFQDLYPACFQRADQRGMIIQYFE